ncbi:MAG: hypothetical protein WDZ82_01300 [Candidatus Paceibacterota bacterium]
MSSLGPNEARFTLVLPAEEVKLPYPTEIKDLPQQLTQKGANRAKQLRKYFQNHNGAKVFDLIVTSQATIGIKTIMEVMEECSIRRVEMPELFYPQGKDASDTYIRDSMQIFMNSVMSSALDSYSFRGHEKECEILKDLATSAWSRLLQTVQKNKRRNIFIVGHNILMAAMIAWSGCCWELGSDRITDHKFGACEGLELIVDLSYGVVSRSSIIRL